MSQTNPFTRLTPRPIRETSTSRALSPRDSDSVQRQWKTTNDIGRSMAEMWNAVGLLQDQLNRLRRRKGGAGETASGMIYKGEWSVSVQYAAQDVVTRWNLGEFVAIATPTAGDPPETDASTWHQFVVQPPGIWA